MYEHVWASEQLAMDDILEIILLIIAVIKFNYTIFKNYDPLNSYHAFFIAPKLNLF